MKLHRTAARLISAALLTLGLLALAAPAFAQGTTAPWNFGEKSLSWRHTGSATTFTSAGGPSYRVTDAVGSWLTNYADSSWMSHAVKVQASAVAIRADTSVVFTIGGMGDNSLEDWVPATMPAAAVGAPDSFYVFQVVFRGLNYNAGTKAISTAIDTVDFILQSSYDNGTTWQTVETNRTVGMSSYGNACSFTYANSFIGFTNVGAGAPTRTTFATLPGMHRIICSRQCWNGAVESVIRYPKFIRWPKGS